MGNVRETMVSICSCVVHLVCDNVMKISIQRVDNGFILSSEEMSQVYSDDDNELLAVQRLLFAIIEYFGYYGSKHDLERLRVVIEKQNEDD